MPDFARNAYRNFEELSARVLLSYLPGSLQVRLSGKPRVSIDGDLLNPEIQLVLRLRELRNLPSMDQVPLPILRAGFRRDILALQGPTISVGSVRDFTIPGPKNSLRVRHYIPEDESKALLVFYHGGGFVLGDLDTHDRPCRFLCKHVGINILSVDYRLAPENKFPAAVDDALAAFYWAVGNSSELGVNRHWISVGGDSAGGNLATVTSILAAQRKRLDKNAPVPNAQLLIYPTTDRTKPYRSLEIFGKDFFLTKADIDWFLDQYARGVDLADPRISPLLENDLAGLPSAVVVTAGFDPLRDEGEAYVEALKRAHSKVNLLRMKGQVHGFINMIGFSRSARAALKEVADAFKEVVKPSRNLRE